MNAEKINIFYYTVNDNMGDLLNKEILERLFKIECNLETIENANLISIGSILDYFLVPKTEKNHENEILNVWGTGLLYEHDSSEVKFSKKLNIHALRGEHTRNQVCQILDTEIDCTLADPALLAPLFISTSPKKYDIGIVPHYVDKKDIIITNLINEYSNAKIIDIQDNPIKVINEITQCKKILATGLHALIVADAYNIPNCWCECSDKLYGDGYKFYDYFSSFSSKRERYDLRSGNVPENKDFKLSFKKYQDVKKKQKELLNSFPYEHNINHEKI